MLFRLFCAAFALAWVLGANAAVAQKKGAASAHAEESAHDKEYRELVKQALGEYELGHWDEAEALFTRAHALDPNARTLRGMGLAEFENRRYVLAVTHLRAALAETRSPLTDSQRNEAENVINRALAFVARFSLDVTPANAEVTLNGRAAERAESGELLLDPGDYDVVAKADGYAVGNTKVSAAAGATGQIVLRLQPLSAQAGAASPGVEAASAAPAASDAAPSLLARPRLWTWVAAATVPVFAGAAAIVWFSGKGSLSDIESACKKQDGCTDAEVARRVDHAGLHTNQTVTSVLLGCAGAALATSAVLFFVEGKRSEPQPTKDLGASVTPFGAMVWGRFE